MIIFIPYPELHKMNIRVAICEDTKDPERQKIKQYFLVFQHVEDTRIYTWPTLIETD